MLVARVEKETTDVRRVIVDWTKWLDPGEQIMSISTPSVVLTDTCSGAPTDSTPLTVQEATIINAGLQTLLLFAAGTPGLAYLTTLIGNGGSGRVQTVEIVVRVRNAPY